MNLARLLHLDPGVRLDPLEETMPVLEIFSPEEDLDALVAQALERRPEKEQYEAWSVQQRAI